MRPLYTNAEALRILGYPISPGDVNSLGSLLAQKMRFAFPTDANLPALPQAREFLSGNRRYLCRFFALEPSLKGPSAPTLVLLMERTLQTAFGVLKIAKQFHLALREQEAVELLCDGLSSREIAQRMEISPNTVKAFLRLVMIKMGVSNRAGIIGKTLKS